MRRSLVLCAVAATASLAASILHAECTTEELKKLKKAEFSLEEIRVLCGLGQQKPADQSAPSTSSTTESTGQSTAPTPSTTACEQVKMDITKTYQACLRSNEESTRTLVRECGQDYAQCMRLADPYYRQDAKDCREERSVCRPPLRILLRIRKQGVRQSVAEICTNGPVVEHT